MQRLWMMGFVVLTFSCGGGDPTGTGGGAGGGSGGFGGGSGSGGGAGASCNANTCAGCCFNGACQPGNTAAACGKLGAACASCATSQICRVDQTCGVDPESTWRVQPTAATIATNDNGTAWDGDGSGPDARVFMWCADATTPSSTAEASDTWQPRWTSGGCSAKAKDLLRAGWSFQLYDVDAISDDTITSRLQVTLTEEHFTNGGFTLSASGGMQSMSVSLTRQ
ncbi:MAG: hypothetical protein ACOZQL_29455 [Myxococcota bacterium]